MKVSTYSLAALTIASLISLSSEAVASKGVIGITLPTQNDNSWYEAGPALVKELQNRGYETVLYYGGDGDVPIQQAQIPRMIKEDRVQAMIVAPIVSNSLIEQLKEAKNNNIPVIAFDNLITYSDAVSYYVGFDDLQVGRMQAQYLIDILGLEARTDENPAYIEMCAGDGKDLGAEKSFNGFIETLLPYIDDGRVKVLSNEFFFSMCNVEQGTADHAMKRMDDIIEKNGYGSGKQKLDAVYCASDTIADGVMDSLERNGYTSDNMPYLTGRDATSTVISDIKGGEHRSTIYRDPELLNKNCVDLVDALLSGQEPEVNDTTSYNNGMYDMRSVLSEPMLISSSNIMFYFPEE